MPRCSTPAYIVGTGKGRDSPGDVGSRLLSVRLRSASPGPMEEEPAPISRGALEGEVSSQMTADSRATLVQRGLLPTPGGMVEAMIQDAVTGALPDSALYGELHFTPEAGP